MDIQWQNFWLNKRYQVSNTGVIWDQKHNRSVPLQINKDGYVKVTLRLSNGRRQTFSVHRLVAELFIPNPDNKPTVNHIDGTNKLDNTVKNLEWATRSEQTQHAWDTGLIQDMDKRKAGIREKQGKPVKCLTTGVIYGSIGEAAETLGLKKSNLSSTCLGKKGFKSCGKTPDGTPMRWRFVNE